MKSPYLSVIIPAYNESKRLPATLVDIDRILSVRDFTYEIIVVDDGSPDNTTEIAKKMAQQIKNLKVMRSEDNHGKGGSVKKGMLVAQGEIRLFMDADNSTSLEEFDKMRPFFSPRDGGGKYDVVIASRAIKGAQLDPPQPFYKQILGKGSNLIIQATNLPGIWDTQCGFKAFTAEAAERIFTISRITGWGFDIEVLSLARALGYNIKEIPVRWVNDLGSHVPFSGYLRTFVENFTILWWRITDSYRIRKEKNE